MTAIRCLAVAILISTFATVAAAQAPLAQVKELYDSASYSEALAALTKVEASADVIDVEKYRALCLLALGRPKEAEQSLQTLALNRPLYNFDTTDASPRLVTLYQDVRRRTLPDAAKQVYQRGRASFENGNMADAARQFKEVVELANSAPPEHAVLMNDLKILADGFLRLAETPQVQPTAAAAAATTQVASVPAAAASASPATSTSSTSPILGTPAGFTPTPQSTNVAANAKAAAPVSGIYDISDSNVKRPVVRMQSVPAWSRSEVLRHAAFRGTLEVIVGEDGSVTSARMLVPTHEDYDTILVPAAQRWRFEPASVDGRPVKYRLLYPINVAPVGR